MTTHYKKIAKLAILASVFLSACTSVPTAAEYSGKWKKVNALEPRVDTIPLEKEYFFTALKIDATLMGLLQRWATDVNLGLEIRCSNDYSVSDKLLDVQTRSLSAAIAEINYIYSKQDLDISLNKDTSFIVFSCGKYNKDSFLNDKQVNVLDSIKQLPFDGNRYDAKKAVPADKNFYDPALKLNVSSDINTLNLNKKK